MAEWSIDIGGVTVEPRFQQYVCSKEPELRRGELLSRPAGHAHIEAFFDSLDYPQHLEILTWQLEIKERFWASTECRMSINVDNALIETEEQRATFLDVVSRFPTPSTFEFTETHPMPPVQTSNRLLRDVRDLGHLTALDDFGTGLNGMSLLTDYDFDVVKIDRSLVFDITDRIEKQKTVKLINQMLNVLGKRHVVEGIDDEEVYRLLKKAGFTTYQGFLFFRPEPIEDAMARLKVKEDVS